eukprot:scaffold227099_cov30-Prasinocladus_malaysianus.AAC.1
MKAASVYRSHVYPEHRDRCKCDHQKCPARERARRVQDRASSCFADRQGTFQLTAASDVRGCAWQRAPTLVCSHQPRRNGHRPMTSHFPRLWDVCPHLKATAPATVGAATPFRFSFDWQRGDRHVVCISALTSKHVAKLRRLYISICKGDVEPVAG